MKKLIALAAAVMVVIPFTVTPASAGPGAGVIAFECTAKLDAFPSPSGSGTCEGGATIPAPSVASGALAGTTDDGDPYVVSGAGAFTAEFTYAEGCLLGEPPLTGAAEGSATVSGLTAVKNGGTTSATLVIDSFTWTRAGLTAAITLGSGRIEFGDGDVAQTFTGAAEAAFAPILTQDNLCPVGGPLQALVVGSAQVADPTL